jgi:hypothetical protein
MNVHPEILAIFSMSQILFPKGGVRYFTPGVFVKENPDSCKLTQSSAIHFAAKLIFHRWSHWHVGWDGRAAALDKAKPTNLFLPLPNFMFKSALPLF